MSVYDIIVTMKIQGLYNFENWDLKLNFFEMLLFWYKA